MLASHVRLLAQALIALLPIQLCAGPPGKAADDGPRAWVPTTHVENQDGVPGAWRLALA